jgi:uncharacterized protein YkwD
MNRWVTRLLYGLMIVAAIIGSQSQRLVEPPAPPVEPPPVVKPVEPPTDGKTLLSLHNGQRERALRINPKLQAAAEKHARWMRENRRMSHRGAGRSSPVDRINAEGYDWRGWGENVAKYADAETAFSKWMGSPPHRRNIKNERFNEVGLAGDGGYWCAVFGTSIDAAAFGADDLDVVDEHAPLFEWEEPDP